ncbi:MAG: c-type cytochrome [Planctomycetes bacterium]|nr:c-type cytochrome [Planctomycetota bacterium]
MSRASTSILVLFTFVAGCQDPVPPGNGADLDQQLRGLLTAAEVSAIVKPSIDQAKVDLGQALFFDKILSGNSNISCSTCHLPDAASGDALSLPFGQGGLGRAANRVPPTDDNGDDIIIPRNAPEVFNRADFKTMFWDARVAADGNGGFTTPAGDQLLAGLDSVLAAQAMFPVTSDAEMRGFTGENAIGDLDDDDLTGIWAALMDRLMGITEYEQMFSTAFPNVDTNSFTFAHAANAIASFEIEHWTLTDAPFDLYLAGDNDAMSEQEKRGAVLFYGNANCSSCHAGTLMTDEEFHNRAVPQLGPGKGDGDDGLSDFGRMRETNAEADKYRFRTPPLRNVADTGPWMHDGAYTTLEAAARHCLDPVARMGDYDPTQLAAPFADLVRSDQSADILAAVDADETTPVVLTDAEVADLVAFLQSLSSPAIPGLPDVDRPASVPSGLTLED